MKRIKLYSIGLSLIDKQKLEDLCLIEGVWSKSEMIRRLIDHAWRQAYERGKLEKEAV